MQGRNESGAILITGNLKDFPKEDFIMSPADFVGKYGKNEGE